MKKTVVSTPDPEEERCPNCGYCPHCGRSNATPTYPYPYYPWGTLPYQWPVRQITTTIPNATTYVPSTTMILSY